MLLTADGERRQWDRGLCREKTLTKTVPNTDESAIALGYSRSVERGWISNVSLECPRELRWLFHLRNAKLRFSYRDLKLSFSSLVREVELVGDEEKL